MCRQSQVMRRALVGARNAESTCLMAMRIPMRSMAARQLHVERQLQTGPAVPTQISAVTANLLDELKYLEETDLRVRFDEFDANRDGIIDIDEAHNHLLSTGRCCCAEDTKAAARHVVEALDGDGDGRVSWDEFKLAATPAVDARVRPIYATLILTFVAQGIQFPVLPQLARSLSLSTADLGLVSASTSLARMVCNVPAALLAERLGRRPLLIAGPAVSGIGMLGLACASSFEHLVLSNIAIGAGMASAMAGASNYLADISMPRNRAQTTAPLLQSALIGFAIGPAVGGVLCQYTGLSLPFVACAAGLAASSVTGALLLPETLDEASVRAVRAAATKQQQQQQQQQQREAAIAVPDAVASATEEVSVQRLLARPALQGLFATILTNGVGQGAMPITMVLYAVETVGMSSAAIGTMLTANVLVMVLASVPASRLSDRVADRKSVMLPALLGGTAFFAAQPLASSALVYALLVGSSGFCQALAMPNTSPLILDHAEPSERARALALRQMVQDGGALLGAAGAGAVAGAYGVPTAIEMVAALQVASTIFCALRSPWKHSKRD